MTLDGVPVDDPGLLLRAGRTPRGPGAILLATLRDVAPGDHTLTIDITRPDGEALEVASTFEMAPPLCAVPLFTVDAAGLPRSARVVVEDRGGPVDLAPTDAATLDTMGRDSVLHSILLPKGNGTLHVAPGWHRLTAVRSIREDVAVWEGVLCEDGTQEPITLPVPTVLETPGAACRSPCPQCGQRGCIRPPCAARRPRHRDRGLGTDRPRPRHDPAPIPASGAMAGAELTQQARASGGHLNVLPLDPARALPSTPLPDTAAVVALAPRNGLVQLNHPRGIQFRPDNPARPAAHALFTHAGFDRDQPLDGQPVLDMLEGITALEVVNRFAWSRYREVRADWFTLLSAGRRIAGTGNSDSHGLALEQIGFPVNLVQASSPEEVPAAVRAGHLTVSTGPVIDLVVRNADTITGPGDTFRAAEGWADVIVTVRAAPWIPVNELRIVQDGEVVHRAIDSSGGGVDRTRVMLRRPSSKTGGSSRRRILSPTKARPVPQCRASMAAWPPATCPRLHQPRVVGRARAGSSPASVSAPVSAAAARTEARRAFSSLPASRSTLRLRFARPFT